MLHVLKDHDERVPIPTHPVELDNVLVLQVGEELSLPLEILPGSQGGILQGLETMQGMGFSNQRTSACFPPGKKPAHEKHCCFPSNQILIRV